MKKLYLTCIATLLLRLAPSVQAESILWVSDNGLKGTEVGSDGVTRGAFYPAASTSGTPFVDQGFVDLLIAAGHTVSRFNPNSTTMSIDDVPMINSYDLIIAGSALNSGPFNLNSRGAKWNTLITKPMIYTKSTLVRRDRTGFLLDNKEYDCAADASTTASGKLTLVSPTHPIFQRIAHSTVGTDEVMNNHSFVRVSLPLNNRGVSVQFFKLSIDGVEQAIANGVESGGKILATIAFNPLDPGVNIPTGQTPAVNGSYVAEGYAIVEWPARSVVRTTQVTDLSEQIAGYRLLFACGTRDAAGSVAAAPNPQVGALDLTLDGQQMFLNAVKHAAAQVSANTWNNSSLDFLWNGTSVNWSSPTVWVENDDALFGETGVGTVLLGGAVTAHNVTFNAGGYSVQGGGNTLTLAGSTPTITANANASIATSLGGVDGLTVRGNSALTLEGDVLSSTANTYVGGTFVRSGTLVLRAVGVSTAGTAYAVDNIEAIDTGATVQIGTLNDGTANTRPADGQILRTSSSGRLNLTGGTFDNNGDDNGLQYPPPEGTGTIVNSSPYKRAVLKLQRSDSGTFVFNGQIKDGGVNVTTSQGVAYQQNIDMNGGNYTMILGGSNSFSGFIRLNSGSGNTIILTNNGTLGYPTAINCPARQILMNSGKIDLNGTSQKVGYVYTGNDANSAIVNSAPGTVSTLIVCFNTTNLVSYKGPATPQGIRSALLDDPTTGGTLALTKEGVAIQPIGHYAGDGTAADNNYHGDTTVNDGILQVLSSGGISANSAYRLNTTRGKLQLDYVGTAIAKALFINGVEMPNGTYGAETAPITGVGFIQVTGSSRKPVINSTLSGSSLTLSWEGSVGGFKLQSKTNSLTGPWFDYLGGLTNPIKIDVDQSQDAVYFRLAPAP